MSTRSFVIEWYSDYPKGEIKVMNGEIENLEIIKGAGDITGEVFKCTSGEPFRLKCEGEFSECEYGKEAAVVTIATLGNAFSFFVKDVSEKTPLFIREYGVVVLPGNSNLSFVDIETRIFNNSRTTKIGSVEEGEEEAYEHAAARTQNFPCETLLGLSRSYKIFTVKPNLEEIYITKSLRHRPFSLQLPIGRGRGARTDIERWLDDGRLPVLRGKKVDDEINYEITIFSTLADKKLTEENVEGTNFMIAEQGITGMEYTDKQKVDLAEARERAKDKSEDEVMLCYQQEAVNTSSSPRYAFFYLPDVKIKETEEQESRMEKLQVSTDGRLVLDDNIYGIAEFNGNLWPGETEQISILLDPGESITVEYRFIHSPHKINSKDKLQFREEEFNVLLKEVRDYWDEKLNQGGKIELPEKRIEEMLAAGILHLDMITYGERDKTLAPTIGWYSPIGTESAPIIQFYDSMGWHDVAERCLDYFLEKQQENGFIQNFFYYMLETGAALWNMAEHYRYTNDEEWVQSIAPKVKKSCEWIIKRRHADTENPDEPGAGMIVGKVADPEDPYRHFMLNGYQYLGLQRAAEMLECVEPETAARYKEEAQQYRKDIRKALLKSIAVSPAVPLGDGRWVPSCSPWSEGKGWVAQGVMGEASFTHNTVYGRDSIIGPLYAIFTEVLDPDELAAQFILESHYEHMCQEGVALSQPYYSRHPILHLFRGEVNTFIKAFYNGFAGLADRETYTFWEHYHGASPHKTHEEGWFLMQGRWMLYLEEDQTLKLLPGVPRRYFEKDQKILIEGVKSYFGQLNLEVDSHLDRGYIKAKIICPQGLERGLETLELRLPHPDKKKALQVRGGIYLPEKELIKIDFDGEPINITVKF